MSILTYAKVAREECIACGLCQTFAPALFAYDQDGIASYQPDGNTGSSPVPPEELIHFKLAYTRCPTGAIKRCEQPFAAPNEKSL